MRYRKFQTRSERKIFLASPALIVGLAAVGVAAVYSLGGVHALTATASGCVVKGNILINSREKIFHVPGQVDYLSTKISQEYGERWFSSEAEALAAGWRKART
ncbi:succinoglycan biosynthesis protein exoi [Pararhizobium sp. PWRC1-1]|uniref:sunset domain-containing protein n=1 Tax=Pararhizobium sp. PWRC1-1 TaxID=2804566 RepID=UPI003CEF5770